MAPVIETPRLLLREFVASDVEALAPIYGDPETSQWLGDGSPRDRAFTSREIERFRRLYAKCGFGPMAVILKESGVLIGSCGLQDLDGGEDVALSYVLGKPWRGKGYSSEAARAVLKFGFESLGLPRIVAVAQPVNAESVTVMKRLGMTFVSEQSYYGIRVVLYEIRRSTQ